MLGFEFALGFQIVEGAAQGFSFISTHLLNEIHQRRSAITDIGCLVECVNHQSRDQLVTTVHGCVLMGAIVANLHNQILAGKTLENGHHGGVGEVSLSAEFLMHLAHRLRRGGVPQVVHHRPFQIAETRHPAHV